MTRFVTQNLEKAALRGEPSHIWREGQVRRLHMIVEAAGERLKGQVLVNGCGVGLYVKHLLPLANKVFGLDIEFPRVVETSQYSPLMINGAGEQLPYAANSFDMILSHEVLEHLQDDKVAIHEMVRTLKPGGRVVLFCPNRGYPFETHGIYWRGQYHFGNKPLVNYLPRVWRDRLAPHVEVYTRRDLENLFAGLPVRFVEQKIVFGAYDNFINRWPRLGRLLRDLLQALEKTPLRVFGLSHFWVVEKND